MKLFLCLIIILSACKTSKIYRPTIRELDSKNYIEVPLQELLNNKQGYHGKFVQTKGFFHFGFEESAIYYDINIPVGDTIIKQRDYCGLWLRFNINDPMSRSYPDSLKNKFVIVKGYFDTTETGHVGGCYLGGLTNSYGLRIIGKVP